MNCLFHRLVLSTRSSGGRSGTVIVLHIKLGYIHQVRDNCESLKLTRNCHYI